MDYLDDRPGYVPLLIVQPNGEGMYAIGEWEVSAEDVHAYDRRKHQELEAQSIAREVRAAVKKPFSVDGIDPAYAVELKCSFLNMVDAGRVLGKSRDEVLDEFARVTKIKREILDEVLTYDPGDGG